MQARWPLRSSPICRERPQWPCVLREQGRPDLRGVQEIARAVGGPGGGMVSSDQATVDHVGRIGAGCNAASRVLPVSAVVSWQISRGQSGRRLGRE